MSVSLSISGSHAKTQSRIVENIFYHDLLELVVVLLKLTKTFTQFPTAWGVGFFLLCLWTGWGIWNTLMQDLRHPSLHNLTLLLGNEMRMKFPTYFHQMPFLLDLAKIIFVAVLERGRTSLLLSKTHEAFLKWLLPLACSKNMISFSTKWTCFACLYAPYRNENKRWNLIYHIPMGYPWAPLPYLLCPSTVWTFSNA